ncbi:histidine kinase [Phormidium sp. LEGE 05292]|uniref:sensor histidine kinase n=1 Tax=[Phormidium] sp. LEGE 05292 TaxID=767427 RepID=UPI0018817B78|nr:ATP-binding protein [Phormidium sp. LEGE 05292]MBE9227546.1 histidine kinase [Phormidium sp. LEGE 05292]
MWDTICFPIAYILVDADLVGGLENIIIAGCYFVISLLIFGDLWGYRKVAVNWLNILIASLFLIGSISYIFSKITIASDNNFVLGQMVGNWLELVPAIAFFIVYQRYQSLLNSTPTIESKQELEQRLREATEKLQQQSQSLQEAQTNLEKIHGHLAQIERLTILGQLVSGIAHEINNPINFIYGNLPYLEEYTQGLLKVIDVYQEIHSANVEIEKVREEVDLDYVRADLPYIIDSIKVGADRIRELVQNLRNFYCSNESKMRLSDINVGIESCLLLLYNLHKNKIEIIKDLDELPPVECYIEQINQVFLTVLGKAINTLLESKNNSDDLNLKQITINSKNIGNDYILIEIFMNAEIKERIFEQTFTPKLIGIGTGLGLSISHRIITEVHQGNLYCKYKLGEGTTFTIELPINQVCRVR